MPARFTRPDIASDEGGLWAMMDREEVRLRRSPFELRDAALHDYVQGIVCRLAGDHCPDVRVHLVRTPFFNASMAPNGMMQVWTGLMLRVENEAQLAAILGHEIGHYLARHSVESLRDAKSRSAFAQFLGMFGLVGVVGQMGAVAGMFAYSRDNEREADRIGLHLMRQAGYDSAEAWKVWANLLLEIEARPGASAASTPMFATHPPPEERKAELAKLAQELPGGVANEEAWRAHIRPHLAEWLAAEVKRGQHEESLALLTRMIAREPGTGLLPYARAEVYRSRARPEDLDAAAKDYLFAASLADAPPETYRGLGFVYRMKAQRVDAVTAFRRYLELAPAAPDAPMITSYVEELKS